MKGATKNITINALGIALFVALSLCLQVPVFQNYYLCLGYFVMTFYCYSIGIISGTLVGTAGVVLYCLITGGINGMPGWTCGNLAIAIIMGVTFKFVKRLKKPLVQDIISIIVIIIATAFGILIIKSGVEYFLYYEPFWFRVARNMYAFVADAFVIIISLPICRLLELRYKKIINK